jgi:subtilisin-like proprotein convertase family protein
MTTSINRVNGILKRDLGIELQLVANNDQIIFTNSADGYTNDDGSAMLSENQTIIDNVIGDANYDLGHVFSTGGGGVAYLSSICLSNVKAGGVTGATFPIGDPFNVDFVAHEIGHQLGATHTQNNDCNSTENTSVEPGSGSTIMGYAGICAPNIQSNSNDYYHSISIDQIINVTHSVFNNCATKTSTNNEAPTANAGSDHTIPHSTPFELEGVSSDPDGDVLTYSWEQMDTEAATMPPQSDSEVGPLFRSLPPSSNPIRQFPEKGNNRNHTPNMWEVLPSVGRSMKFRLTVRDNFSGGGNNAKDETIITTSGSSGPFKVLSPNGGENLAAGVNHQVTWDVAGSNQAPVSCEKVNIYLSTDGGDTYPIVLAENVPNDGNHDVFIQNTMITTAGRIKIKGADNVFFDVSDSNFEISQAAPGFLLNISPIAQFACQGDSPQFSIDVLSVDNFSGNVQLSAAMPSELSSYFFQTTTVSTGNSTVLTINLSNTTVVGTFDIVVKGVSGDKEITKNISLTVANGNISNAALHQPSNQAKEVFPTPTFSWSAVSTANRYELEVSTEANFTSIFYKGEDIKTNEFEMPFNLESGKTYYWRVRAINHCSSSVSAIFSFTVSNTLCTTYKNETSYTITPEERVTIEAPIVVSDNGKVNSVKVNFSINHTWIGDLTVILESPSGKQAKILTEICGNEDQINLIFANEGLPNSQVPCEPPVSENVYLPIETFNIFDGEEANGTWKLKVVDDFVLDGGTLNNWNLELCRSVEDQTPLNVLITNTVNPTCNGHRNGKIQATIVGGQPNYTINWSNGSSILSLNDIAAGNYSVTVTDGQGTVATAQTTLTEPNPLVLTEVIKNATCNGVNNGSIQVFPSGGTPNYQYNWANGVRQFNNLNLPKGLYALTVTDNNGCTKEASYTVEEPPAIQLSFQNTNAINGQNGKINMTVTGGKAPYTYAWSNGASTQNIENLTAGDFTVTVTDANNCSQIGETQIESENTGQECYNIIINVTLDNYGEENKWELKDANGELVQKAGPFNNFENGKVESTTICLPPGCYDFTIFDQWGDGMCCSYGNGGYEVVEELSGKVLASGQSFNKTETTTLCIPSNNGATVIDYCGANGRNTQYEWIEAVEIAGQVFQSGNNEGYGDFSETIVDASIGGTLNLAFTPGFGFFKYNENWQIWIDFNIDGDFDDEGENVLFTSGNERVEGVIGIPATAKAGKTRMRVAMKWGKLIEPCESFSWGEVEDYTINLTQTGLRKANTATATTLFTTRSPELYTVQNRINATDINLYPNPASDFIHLEWESAIESEHTLAIYDALGQVHNRTIVKVNKGTNRTSIPVDQLSAGLYLLSIQEGSKRITKEFIILE